MSAAPIPPTSDTTGTWSCSVSGATWADVSASLDIWLANQNPPAPERNQFSQAVNAARGMYDAVGHPSRPCTVTLSGSVADPNHLSAVVVEGEQT